MQDSAREARVEIHADGMDADTGPLGDLRLQGPAQVIDVPLGGIVAPAQGGEDAVVVLVPHPVRPEPAGGPVETADALDLRAAETGPKRLGKQRQQGANRVFQLRDPPLAKAVAAGLEGLGQLRLGHLPRFVFRRDQSFDLDHRLGLVEEAQLAAQVVLLEMGEEDVGFPRPGPVKAGRATESAGRRSRAWSSWRMRRRVLPPAATV